MDEKQQADLKQSPPGSPSAASNSSVAREEAAHPAKKARRTFLTQNACTRCRQKKSKCDGKRPICGRCEKHGAECLYDVAQEGVTRMQNLQQQLESKSGEHSKLMNLFNAFQHGSDYEATTLLARLRLGANVDDLLSLVGGTQSSASGSQGDPIQPQVQPPPGYIRSWPPSPLDEGSWTSWSTRCQPSGRTLSHSSDSRLDGPSLGGRMPAPDSTMSIRDGFLQNEPRDGYYPMQRENFPGQQRDFAFNSIQWQDTQGPDGNIGNVSPTMTIPSGSYYEDSEQSSRSQMKRNQRQYAQRDGARQGAPRDSRS